MSFDPQPTRGTRAIYEAIGMGMAGLSPDFFSFFDDFDYAQSQVAQKWAQSSSGSAGSTFPLPSTRGGQILLSTGTTAASAFDLTSQIALVDNSRTAAWYMAARFAVPLAIDNQAVVGFGLDDGSTQSVIAGICGPVNASNFVVQHSGRYAGSAINLAVAADTNMHVFEAWCTGDGATLFARLDGGAILSAAPAASVVTAVPRGVLHNGTTAANRRIQPDWTLFMSGRS